MQNVLRAPSDLVTYDLVSLGPNGPYRLIVHHTTGSIVEYFDSVTAALLRQGELEDLLRAARASDTAAPAVPAVSR